VTSLSRRIDRDHRPSVGRMLRQPAPSRERHPSATLTALFGSAHRQYRSWP
jgi:hypothetical protein